MAATEMSAWERFDRFTTRFMDRAIVAMQWILMGSLLFAVVALVILVVLSFWQ